MSPSPESGSFITPDDEIRPGQEEPEGRREKLLAEIDRNVGRVLELQNIVDQEMFANNSDQVIKRLGEYQERLWGNVGEERIRSRDEWRQLIEQRGKIIDQTATDGDFGDLSDEQIEQMERNYEEVDKLNARQVEIEKDDELYNLLCLDRLTTSLQEKAIRVSDYQRDRSILIRDITILNSQRETSVDESDIQDVRYDTFGVSIIIGADRFKKIFPGYKGIHIGQTPLSFIEDADQKNYLTIDHERLHNMVDGVPLHNGNPTEPLNSVYKRIKNYLKLKAPKILIDQERKYFRKILKRSPDVIVDQLHEELLAELPTLRDQLKSRVDEDWMDAPIEYPLLRNEWFKYFCRYASTAGRGAYDYSRLLTSIAIENVSNNIELAVMAQEAERGFGKAIQTMLRHMVECSNLASQYGPQAERDVQAALFIFRPSKYRHISTYIKHKYGADDKSKDAKKSE